jgi:imidazolonepropionase-like amidohydrolase
LSLGRTCDGVPAVLKATREELKAGADFIKIMCGGGVASMTDAIETVQFTAEEIRAITTTCKQMGNIHSMSLSSFFISLPQTVVPKTNCAILATAHAYTNESVLHAINNGVMGIEHGNLIDESTARLFVIYFLQTIIN